MILCVDIGSYWPIFIFKHFSDRGQTMGCQHSCFSGLCSLVPLLVLSLPLVCSLHLYLWTSSLHNDMVPTLFPILPVLNRKALLPRQESFAPTLYVSMLPTLGCCSTCCPSVQASNGLRSHRSHSLVHSPFVWFPTARCMIPCASTNQLTSHIVVVPQFVHGRAPVI
jgi:hypothetical protein